MGLYDTVRSNYRLPDVEVKSGLIVEFKPDVKSKLSYGTEFQTKDFYCLLEEYLITSFGTLCVYENGVNVDTQYHGIFNFYTSVPVQDEKRYMIEYEAKFTDGKLVSVKGYCPANY
jgi:hypothetical protein